ncbi:hypothetical protein [Cerasicoccus arenae]|uniref:Porin n=1 Tax=Cerasicoccus arenae TaxID=424488 RepID=A0A8J3DJQ9_9BACT|nr:hypothetical protein [Cerasicoccus arenae]MBK1856874.1 hypothetical protein [Cerasicoccus arenae]GHC11424.1 hypothetical protein GCM10007047_30960 [Cerasicoccus arenae]
MKKTIATIAIIGAATGASADFLSDLSISGTFDFETEYVYRASKLADQSFQPSVEFGYPVLGGDLYAGVWTNQPITPATTAITVGGIPVGTARAGIGNEIDFYAGYAYPVTDIFTVDLGATYYWYPESAGAGAINHTTEVYFGVSADVLLSPAVYFYYDFDLKQTLVELSIGYSLDLGEYLGAEGLSIDTGAYFGLLNTGDTSGGSATNFILNPPVAGLTAPVDNSNGYTYGGVTGDLVYAFSENVSGSIGVRWSINNDGDSGTLAGNGPANFFGSASQVWFGSTLGFSY